MRICFAFSPTRVDHVLSPRAPCSLNAPHTHTPTPPPRHSQAPPCSHRCRWHWQAGLARQSRWALDSAAFNATAQHPALSILKCQLRCHSKMKAFLFVREKKRSLEITGTMGRIWAGSLSPQTSGLLNRANLKTVSMSC